MQKSNKKTTIFDQRIRQNSANPKAINFLNEVRKIGKRFDLCLATTSLGIVIVDNSKGYEEDLMRTTISEECENLPIIKD